MSDGSTIGETLAVGGGALAVVGALLPWSGSGLFDGFGLEARAIVTLVLAIAVFGVRYAADWTETAQLLVILIGLAMAGLAGVTLAEAVGLLGDGAASASIGLYVTLLAGLLILAGGLRAYTYSPPEAGMYSHR